MRKILIRRSPTVKKLSTSDILEVIQEDRESEMTRLKFVAKKLNLATRRPSYMKWLEDLKKPALANYDKNCENWKETKAYGERKREVEEGISWLKSELEYVNETRSDVSPDVTKSAGRNK
ncbi:uncharacterized protein [Antedon mediterranea]|uniref:uncharacterized protein isoform X2 n=1 Tax=Antedon mediterranea TaxID=105859 RepID=UPI003AF6CE02